MPTRKAIDEPTAPLVGSRGMLGWPFIIGLLQGFVFVMLLLILATS
jgi:hypothetical protein